MQTASSHQQTLDQLELSLFCGSLLPIVNAPSLVDAIWIWTENYDLKLISCMVL